MTPIPLAEELLLLAYDDETGKASGSQIGLDLGMAAAVLVELALAGRIAMDGNMIICRDATPVGEPIADAVLAKVAEDAPHSAASWVQRLRHRLRERVLEDLCARGVMRDVDEMALEHIHIHRYPTVDSSVERDVRTRLTAALSGATPPDERTAALATILAAVRMEPSLGITGDEIRITHRKLEEIASRAGFSGDVDVNSSTVRPSVALVVAALIRAIETALGRAPA
ncbi:MAG TPA: GPP34 family phosphoprotein [Micromonosporaceae bacterium]|nr:GPP34 family phosphoprotein [Micromonosporaceae bacterium]